MFAWLSMVAFLVAVWLGVRHGFQEFLAPSDLWIVGCLLLGLGFAQAAEIRQALREGRFTRHGATFSRDDGGRDFALHLGMLILPAMALIGLGGYLIALPWLE